MMRTDRAHWIEQPEVGEVRGESCCGGWMGTTDVGLQKGKEGIGDEKVKHSAL